MKVSEIMDDSKQTGQNNFDPLIDKGRSEVWGGEIDTKRFDSSLKLGYVFPQVPFHSFGNIGTLYGVTI